jgi:adenosylcobinamide kinase/adenosylcobinamide-phosphate guanylyltransferase
VLILLTGGARSGKSALAVELAAASGDDVVFIATASRTDGDMAARIERHRDERPSHWRTLEVPLDLAAALAASDPAGTVLIDCLSLWTANAMAAAPPEEVEREAQEIAMLAAARPGLTIAVTNEVGMGVHPSTEIGRNYRDVLGRVNASWSRTSAHAYLIVASRAVSLADTDVVVDQVRG